jgi:uncharacterized protein
MTNRIISPSVAGKLGYYIYLYINPFDNSIFYVGKGKGSRVLAHLSEESESRKVQTIRDIRSRGGEPRIEILVHGLQDELTALRIEAAVIDLLGIGSLTNQVRGWESRIVGRMDLKQLVALYDAQPAIIDVPAILIRINRLYRYGMSELELYEATRGIWKVNPQRRRPQFAFSVYKGVVLEVYRIKEWHRAGTTTYETRTGLNLPDRWEFVGSIAEEAIRAKYVDKSVTSYFSDHSQNPVQYVRC